MFSVSPSLKMQPSYRPHVHVVEGDVPSLSDVYIHELVGVKPPCLHASYSGEHAKHRDLPAGHIHFPLQVELHVACLGAPLCMKSVYSKTSSRSRCGIRDRVSHACESGHSTGLPGFPPTVGGLAARSVAAPALAKCCSVFPFPIY